MRNVPHRGPGTPRTIRDDAVERVVTRTLKTKPEDANHWSTRGRAKAAGLSQSAVSRVWRAFGSKPHLADTLKLSADPFFVQRVRDVVGLDLSPPDNAIVLCVDEESGTQALDRTRPVLPMAPTRPEQGTHDSARQGTTSLFAALEVATGKVIGKCLRRHRQQEFVGLLDHPDAAPVRVPGGGDARRAGQLRDAQDAVGEGVVPEAPGVRAALPADECVVAQPGGAIRRGDHPEGDSPGRLQAPDGRKKDPTAPRNPLPCRSTTTT